MKKSHSNKYYFHLIFTLVMIITTGCSDNGNNGIYSDSTHVAVDSENTRLFIYENGPTFFALTADSRIALDANPIVSDTTSPSIQSLLPDILIDFETLADGTTTRLFFLGAMMDEDSNIVTNRIRVLDFSGSSFSEPDFSPIILSDGDEATDESDDTFADLAIDTTGRQILVSNTTAGLLFVLSADNGSTLAGPIALGGAPRQIDVTNNRAFVCNSSEDAAEQLIDVVALDDYSQTALDLDIPCSQLAADENGSVAIIAVKSTATGDVLLRQVNTENFTETAVINAGEEGLEDGGISSGAGITSNINDLVLGHSSSGSFILYASETDGNIQSLTISADAASFSHQTLSTTASQLEDGAIFTDSDGNAVNAFFASPLGFLATIEWGANIADLDN